MERRTEWTAFEQALAAEMQSRPAAETAECLEPEQLLDLIEGNRDDPAARRLLGHIASCAHCRREYFQMQETWRVTAEARQRNPVASPHVTAPAPSERPAVSFRLRPWFLAPAAGFTLGAAAAGLIVTVTALRPLQTQNIALQRQNAEAQRQAAAAREQLARQQEAAARQLAQQRQAFDRQVAQMSQGRNGQRPPEAIEPRNEEDRQTLQALEAAARLRRVGVPQQVALLSLRSSSGPEKPQIALVRPVATFVREDQPILEAAAPEGATRYAVTVIDPDAPARAIKTVPLGKTQWKVAEALRRGRVFEWWVTARKDGQEVASPIARFQVLGSEAAERLARATRRYADLPLTLGVLYAQAGLLDDAERQLRLVLQTSPEHPLAQALLRDLQAKRNPEP